MNNLWKMRGSVMISTGMTMNINATLRPDVSEYLISPLGISIYLLIEEELNDKLF